MLRDGTDVEVRATHDPEQLETVLAEAAGRSVVVAGGDGSLHAVVRELHHTDMLGRTTLGLLPLGTGNDFARAVGLPLDPADAARVVLAGRSRRMDLLVGDDGRIVVNHVHAGARAQASRRAGRRKRRLHAVGAGSVNLGRLGYHEGSTIVVALNGLRLLRRQAWNHRS